VDGRMVVEQLGILAGGWKDGCGAIGNISWWMGRMVVERVGILTVYLIFIFILLKFYNILLL
jgi:hypothetical protein